MQHSAVELLDRPSRVVFHVVMTRTQVSQIVVIGGPAGLPVDGVVEVAIAGEPATSGEAAGFVSHAEVATQVDRG